LGRHQRRRAWVPGRARRGRMHLAGRTVGKPDQRRIDEPGSVVRARPLAPELRTLPGLPLGPIAGALLAVVVVYVLRGPGGGQPAIGAGQGRLGCLYGSGREAWPIKKCGSGSAGRGPPAGQVLPRRKPYALCRTPTRCSAAPRRDCLGSPQGWEGRPENREEERPRFRSS
jgi:hypothetical protein